MTLYYQPTSISSGLVVLASTRSVLVGVVVADDDGADVNERQVIVRAVFESISELSQYLEPEHLEILFQHIESIQLCDYNEYVLDFVRRFTANAIEASGGHNRRWYGIDIFWRLIEDESPASAELALR